MSTNCDIIPVDEFHYYPYHITYTTANGIIVNKTYQRKYKIKRKVKPTPESTSQPKKNKYYKPNLISSVRKDLKKLADDPDKLKQVQKLILSLTVEQLKVPSSPIGILSLVSSPKI